MKEVVLVIGMILVTVVVLALVHPNWRLSHQHGALYDEVLTPGGPERGQ